MHDRERCMLLVRTSAGRQTIVHASRQAVEAGVEREMTLAHARSLLAAEPLVREYVSADDQVGLERLAVWATRFSPSVMVDPDDHGLLIDITGCERIYRGEHNLLKQLLDAVAS
ncbi:MAG: hypothetical protein WD079_06950, partial [Phycisphaeraceae bacterium]